MIVLFGLSLGPQGFRYSHLPVLLQAVAAGRVLLQDALVTETNRESVRNKIKGRLQLTARLKTGL